MNKNATTTASTRRQRANKENKRQDWGYTDQYRRMMQRDNRKQKEPEKEQ